MRKTHTCFKLGKSMEETLLWNMFFQGQLNHQPSFRINNQPYHWSSKAKSLKIVFNNLSNVWSLFSVYGSSNVITRLFIWKLFVDFHTLCSTNMGYDHHPSLLFRATYFQKKKQPVGEKSQRRSRSAHPGKYEEVPPSLWGPGNLKMSRVKNGRFLQWMTGKKKAILETFRRIERNPWDFFTWQKWAKLLTKQTSLHSEDWCVFIDHS